MFLKVSQPITKFIMAAFVGLSLLSGHAFAKVEINSADQAALESVRGLGPSLKQRLFCLSEKRMDHSKIRLTFIPESKVLEKKLWNA